MNVWPSICCRIVIVAGFAVVASRGAASAQDAAPEPPAITTAASDVRISMDLKDADLKDVLKIFSQQSGLNFIASERVRDRQVTLYLDQVSVQDALDSIIQANDLTYEQADGSNIFVVKEVVRPAVETETRIYTLGYARVSSSPLGQSTASLGRLASSLVGASSSSATLGGGWTTSGTVSGETTTGSGSSGASTTIGAGAASAGAASSRTFSPIGIDQVIRSLLSPHGSLVVDERTNSLIITDVASQFPFIEKVIAQLDTPTPQVMIEAEILEVSRSTLDRLGVEWGDSTGQLLTFSSASRTTALPFKRTANREGEVPTMTMGTVNGPSAVLRLLEQDGSTKILARPRVLTLNNESAVMKIVANTAIGVESTTATAAGTAGVITSTPQRVETGISLTVTPQVNKDGYVTMYIEPAVTRPVASEFFPGQFVDPQTRGASTVVRVKNGETAVIGGLLEKNDTTTHRKIPLLGDLPLLGAPFRSTSDTGADRELIVFITPHIVQDPSIPQAVRAVAMADREQDIQNHLLKVEEIDRALAAAERQVEALVMPRQQPGR